MPAEKVERAGLEGLSGSPDELGRLFVVENDGRGWPWGPEEDGADHHRLDGMPARVGYRSMIVPDLPADT